MGPQERETFFKRMFALGVPKASWLNYMYFISRVSREFEKIKIEPYAI